MSAMSTADEVWDRIVTRELGQYEQDMDERVDNLVKLLSHISAEETVKKEYALVYIALSRLSDEVETSDNAYSDMLLSYDNGVGVKERNLHRYTIRLFHAVLIGDQRSITELKEEKNDLSYMDQFPGVLRDLVKRRTIGDSSVKMNGVAEIYPDILLHILKDKLNYRDLAELASGRDEKYNGFRYSVYETMNRRIDPKTLEALVESGARLGPAYTRLFLPSFAADSDWSILLLVNEVAKIQPDFILTFEEASKLANFFTKSTSATASYIPELLRHVTGHSEYPQGPEMVSAVRDVNTADIPLGEDGKTLPIALYANPNGSSSVQIFLLDIVRSYYKQ